ncbi:MAG TPA: tannase/feruloyl esterase family alpha/beta hydrolase [Blastocatellia bacterium]|jgi:feruloyl esterase|nr:tannase/feruloyl esterase family alpha/beta hydrolase [Blastocatellia bacterium]
MNRHRYVLSILLHLSLASSGLGQNGVQFRDWKPSLNDGAAVKPKRAETGCEALLSLSGYEFSIETAAVVPASGDLPEYCHVTGQILPEVRFELSLPASWNNRFYMFGNGGFAGETLTAPQRVNTRNTALKARFAVAQTNTGHDAANEPLGTFAVNRQKLLDYAFRAVHVTAETSKRIIREYYGAAPARSYFDGCSTGGRQGLISAQRFPDDFDGIVVGAPVLDLTGTMTSYIPAIRALEAAPVPLEKMKIVADRVYAKCDGADGLLDGLIDDPRRCDFDPAKELPVCADDADGKDCFTAAQIHTLGAIYRGAESGGRRIFWGQPVGAEIGAPTQTMWANWIIPPSPAGRAIIYNFAETFFRYLAFPKPDPNYDIKSFNFETDIQKLRAISDIIDAKNPDLSRFKARGGKIVMYFGWADPALNPLMGVDYYEKVSARFGPSTTDFFRLFMVPGMGHCRGGVGTDQSDFLTALIEWVEKGVAPNRLTASQSRDGRTVRSRPLCPYPQVAKYNGTGNPDDAQSFVCENHEKRR